MQTLRNLRNNWMMRLFLSLAVFSLAWLEVSPAYAQSREITLWEAAHQPGTGLPKGLTQTPSAALMRKIMARKAAEQKTPDVRPLSLKEMAGARGRGTLRNPYLAGAPMPWHRTFQDVNMCTGNLSKTFTDIQVAAGRGAGLALGRTYNSQDERVGPFGVGWTHSYDIRIQEAPDVQTESGNTGVDGSADDVPRTDFFGHKHTYHRDADGLYTPPAYLYDETQSDYDTFLANGPAKVQDDTEIGMDGTIKHYTNVVTLSDGSSGNERACDYIQDRYGNTTTLSYGQSYTQADGSTRHILTSVTDPVGRQLKFSWTNYGTGSAPIYRITQVQGPTYRVTYGYNTDHNLSSVTLDPDNLNRTTNYTYTTFTSGTNTEAGLLASISDPLGHTVSYTYAVPSYNPTGTLWVSTLTEPASGGTQVWTFSLYNSGPYSCTVDNGSFPTADPDGLELATTVWFDSYLRTTVNQPRGEYNNNIGWMTSYATDNTNNVTTTRNQFVLAGAYEGDSYTYGSFGNVLTHTTSGFTPQDSTTYYNASQYFQKSSVTDMDGHVTSMMVGTNSAGTIGDPDPNIGDRGQVLTVQDAGYSDSSSPSYHKQYTYTYNSYGQRTSETNLNGMVTLYTYGDQYGNLTKVVQDSSVDVNGNAVPGTGHLNRTTTMVYDVMGRVLQSTDPHSLTSTFTYNSLGQLLTVNTPTNGTVTGETITYTYDANGRTHTVADARGTTTMGYETGDDRVLSVTDPVNGAVSYTYYRCGARKTMTLPSGTTYTYTYIGGATNNLPKDDPESLAPWLASIKDDQNRIVEYSYLTTQGPPTNDQMRQVKSDETYDMSGNLVTYMLTTYQKDSNGSYSHNWLSQVNTTWNYKNMYNQWVSRVIASNDYTKQGTDTTTGFDPMGQRLSNKVTLSNYAGTSTTSHTERYTYDDLNRLNYVNYDYGATNLPTQTYTFDAMGNRTQRVDSSAGTTNYTVNGANMLTAIGSQAVTSDADGNTLTDGSHTNTWDSQNRMTACTYSGTASTFTYGADGLRRQMTTGGTTTNYVLDNDMTVQEMQGGAVHATYFCGMRGPECRIDNGGSHWYVYDGLGSVLGEVDPSGNLTASQTYDVYGMPRNHSGTSTTPHGFVGSLGHPSDANTGYIYMRARYMDPNTGRLVSQDPKQSGENWYAYCLDNPTNSVDRDGKDPDMQLVSMIGTFMLAAFTCRTFQASMLITMCVFLLAILAPVAFAVGSFIPFGGFASGAAFAIMTIQAIYGMINTIAASPGFGCVTKVPLPIGPLGAAYEISALIGGYASFLWLVMAADDAVDQIR